MNWNIKKISGIKDQILYKHPKYNTILKSNNEDIDLFREQLHQAMKEDMLKMNDIDKAEQYYENQAQKDNNSIKITKDMFINKEYDNVREDENDR